MDVFRDLVLALGEENVKKNETLASHTTFRIGGVADYFVTPKDEKGLMAALTIARESETPVYRIGHGSNLLFSDKGYRGMIIKIGKGMDHITWLDETMVKVGAGASLSKFALDVAKKGFEGFEFAAGIPGSVGGAVTMNAGAYGGEIKDSIVSVEVMGNMGDVRELSKEELKLGYRTSVIQLCDHIVTSANFTFQKGKKEEILKKIKELNTKRKDKQPLDRPSAGSTFKRPEGYFAGKLIEDAGLKGYRIGDAMVSDKHSGFIINAGEATAAEVLLLVEYIQKEVFQQFHVNLEPEIRLVGEW
jgi:UDP-N-acetylmuramate dehydrogenase